MCPEWQSIDFCRGNTKCTPRRSRIIKVALKNGSFPTDYLHATQEMYELFETRALLVILQINLGIRSTLFNAPSLEIFGKNSAA